MNQPQNEANTSLLGVYLRAVISARILRLREANAWAIRDGNGDHVVIHSERAIVEAELRGMRRVATEAVELLAQLLVDAQSVFAHSTSQKMESVHLTSASDGGVQSTGEGDSGEEPPPRTARARARALTEHGAGAILSVVRGERVCVLCSEPSELTPAARLAAHVCDDCKREAPLAASRVAFLHGPAIDAVRADTRAARQRWAAEDEAAASSSDVRTSGSSREEVSHHGRSCPVCGVGPGERCVTRDRSMMRVPLGYMHPERSAFVCATCHDVEPDSLGAKVRCPDCGRIPGGAS